MCPVIGRDVGTSWEHTQLSFFIYNHSPCMVPRCDSFQFSDVPGNILITDLEKLCGFSKVTKLVSWYPIQILCLLLPTVRL